MIGTDCIGDCKSNYHTITTMKKDSHTCTYLYNLDINTDDPAKL